MGRVVAIGYSRAVSDFDYDQLVIGSGLGGSVAALRLAERMTGVVPDRYFHGEGLEALRNAMRDASPNRKSGTCRCMTYGTVR